MNAISEFDRSYCGYCNKSLNELLEEDENKYSIGMYEREYISRNFYVLHGNEIVNFNQSVVCMNCNNIAYIDETEQYVIDAYLPVTTIQKFDNPPVDFDWESAGLKSADDADYFYISGWVARLKSDGKMIDCAEFSINERVKRELTADAQKYVDQIKSRFSVSSLNPLKSVKLAVWNMRDLIVPAGKGFLVRDVQTNTKLLYGNERGIQCPHCRTYLSTVKANWTDDLDHVEAANTTSFENAVMHEFELFDSFLVAKLSERAGVLKFSRNDVVDFVRDTFQDKIYDIMLDAVSRDMLHHTTCTRCDTELLFASVEEIAPTVSEVVPFLDADTSEMVMVGRFGTSNVAESERRVKSGVGDFLSAWGEIFGVSKAKEPVKSQDKEEKLPKGWKFIKV